MATGDIGKKIKEARESMRPIMSQKRLAGLLGVDQPRLSNWERGKHDPPGDILPQASKVLGKGVPFFYGETPDEQTNVYYNDSSYVDSALDSESLRLANLASDPRIVTAVGIAVEGISGPWSAKNAQRVKMPIHAFLASGNLPPIRLSDPQPQISLPSGTVLVFQDDEYPHPDVYLLIQSRANQDLHEIRYIDAAGSPTALVTECPTDRPYSLSDWKVLGNAYAMIQGKRLVVLTDGIGPRRR